MCVDSSSASSCHTEITMKTPAHTLPCQPVSEDIVHKRVMLIAMFLHLHKACMLETPTTIYWTWILTYKVTSLV